MKIERESITFPYVASIIGKDDGVFLDIGANRGASTRAMLRAMPQGKIHAFEIDPRALKKFKAGTSSPQVTLHELAIGAIDGEMDFYMSSGQPLRSSWWKDDENQGWDLSGSIKKPTGVTDAHPWCKFEDSIKVPVVKLDTWYSNTPYHIIDFIWADVQGAERDLINGGLHTLENTRYLYTEYSNVELYEDQPTLEEILDLLPGFSIVKLYKGDVLLRNTAL